MFELTQDQIQKIEELSQTVVTKRNELLTYLCEILGDDFYMVPWCGGGNSYVLYSEKENVLYAVRAYRFSSPTSYALKEFIGMQNAKSYSFNEYGKMI